MKLLFKQKFFSWFDSYNIFDESGNTVYTVKGQLSWGHCFKIFDKNHEEVGKIKERIITLLPKFEIYMNGDYIGSIRKRLSLFIPRYEIDFMDWDVSGGILEWNYSIYDRNHNTVADISKKLLNFTDTYEIDVKDEKNALSALMFVLAIDAEKCSRN
ncbi:MAG: LURP-one-related family protein [Treponema sp.]|nr:LURP-one-related family protein [Treponema sp.]